MDTSHSKLLTFMSLSIIEDTCFVIFWSKRCRRKIILLTLVGLLLGYFSPWIPSMHKVLVNLNELFLVITLRYPLLQTIESSDPCEIISVMIVYLCKEKSNAKNPSFYT